MTDKELTTVPEFLNRYSISRTAFYREILAGRLEIVKRGRRTLVTRQAADNWVKSLEKGIPEQPSL